MRFFKKRNINNIISSDSDSDIDKCNSDSEYNEDINEILRELVIEEEKKVDDTESAIQFSKWSEFSGRQKSFSFSETALLDNYLTILIHMIYFLYLLMMT